MAIQQKLQTKLAQKLILTPSLQQAIKLLPMSTLELADLLNQEVVENPLLEEVPTEDLAAQEQTPAEKEGAEDKTKDKDKDPWDDADYEYFFGDYLDDGYRPRAPQEVKELPPIENTLSTSSSLTDHLEWQLSLQTTDDAIREIGEAIIGNLDDDGYLVASVDEIASMGPWPVDKVEEGLRLIQSFDPIGVAARDLQECLTLQIKHLHLEGTPTEKIVSEHLRLLHNHQMPELARKLGLTIEELKSHVEIIQHLDPKPGSRFNPQPSQYVIPGRLHHQGRGSVRRGAERGRPAAAAHQPDLSPAARQGRRREQRRDPRLREGQVPLRAVADQVGGAAAEDHPQGRDQHLQFPARLPRSRHRAPAVRWCCATSPTTSACTNRRSAAS